MATQPNYLPWLGSFDQIARADVCVWLDDVQYTRRDWRNRNRIDDRGEPRWLTVPVKTRGRFDQAIRDAEIDEETAWRQKHLATIARCYAAAPHRGAVLGLLTPILLAGHRLLADLTVDLSEAIAAALCFNTRFVRGSSLAVAGRGEHRLIGICDRVGADLYLSGPAARAYIEPGNFAAAGIELRYIVYDYEPYPRDGRPYLPGLSIVDPLMWMGFAGTAEYIRRHVGWEAA